MAYIGVNDQFCAEDYHGLVIGLAADIAEHDSGYHIHNKDQLLFSHHGCMVISLDGVKCVLPPMRAAWIPAGIEHKAQTSNATQYRSLYFDQSLQSQLPRTLKIFDINPLMSALMERMAFWPFDKPDGEQLNSVNLLIEELNLAQDSHLNLPIPADPRLASWLAGIDDEEFIAPTLAELSLQVGASAKTITRIFNKEVGMPYQNWRQQWRLLAAIELLSKRWRVSTVAHHLAFSSDSAFISFFREKTGYTPAHFIRENKE